MCERIRAAHLGLTNGSLIHSGSKAYTARTQCGLPADDIVGLDRWCRPFLLQPCCHTNCGLPVCVRMHNMSVPLAVAV